MLYKTITFCSLLVVIHSLGVPYSVDFQDSKKNVEKLLNKESSGKTLLIESMRNVNGMKLTAEEETQYFKFVDDLEKTVIDNAAIASKRDKLLQVSEKLNKFQSTSKPIYNKSIVRRMGSWGKLRALLDITSEWKFDSALEMVLQNDVTGNTKLFDDMLSAATPAQRPTLETFINGQLKPIILDNSLKSGNKLGAIYDKFYKSMSGNADFNSYLDLTLPSFGGSFATFYHIAQKHYQKPKIDSVITGAGEGTVLTKALENGYKTGNMSTVQKVKVKTLMKDVTNFFNKESDKAKRIVYVSRKFNDLVSVSSLYLDTFGFLGIPDFGDFYNFIVTDIQAPLLLNECQGCTKPDPSASPKSTTVLGSTISDCSCTCPPGVSV